MSKIRLLLAVLDGLLAHPLNQRSRLRALWSFVRWQMRSRMAGRAVVVDWICGSKLVASQGDSGVTGNIYTGLYDFEEMAFLLHALRPEDTFLDAGANAGCYTILASKVVGTRTVAFEPVPSTYARLLANLRANSLEHLVSAYNVGLGAGIGRLKFSTNLDSTNHVVLTDVEHCNTVRVDVFRIDDLKRNDIFALKVDVEGFEMPILLGARKLLRDPMLSIIVLELNNSGLRYGYSDTDIISLVKNSGFCPIKYDPWTRKLGKLPGAHPTSKNTIFVRDFAGIMKRVQESRAYEVNGILL